MDGKTKAIVAHLWWIGWVIALVVNSSEKDEFASFYIRQNLGLLILSFVTLLFRFSLTLMSLVSLALFIFWLLSLIGALQGEKKETPVVGKYFQDWFKGL